MTRHGFVRGQMDPGNFWNLRETVLGMRLQSDGIITGKYKMSKIQTNELYGLARNDILPFEKLAHQYLSYRYPNSIQPIQVEMDESAILVNPPPTHGQTEKAQIYHADDISGTGVTFIISLTDNCLSTYCLSTTLYGPDYPTSLSVDRLISCDYFANTRGNQDIHSAVRERYRPVCSMSPDDFFQKADGGQPVPAGHYTAFSHDTMHAGPSGNHGREVLFLHFRVKSKKRRPHTNIQYRIDALMEVCGYSESEREDTYNKWVAAGHWSPYGFA
jgi:hypothetical protein